MMVAVVIAVVAALVLAYRQPVVPLSRARRTTLVTLRAMALAALLIVLLRPVAQLSPSSVTRMVVPILIDRSGSMGIADADGVTRVARARAIAQFDLAPVLKAKYAAPIVDVGDASHSDLSGAIAGVREQFRGQRVAGMVLLSDGADTGPAAREGQTSPVFAIGVGSTRGLRDREVVSIAAGDQRLTDASVDLQVSASSAGFGRAPYEVRLMANGARVETKRVTPLADASPDHVRFTVFPDPSRANVYTAEIPTEAGETITENNARSVLIAAAGRKRRILVIAGAPGFEPSFMARAWALDPGLEADVVVRKGRNADARDTFVIQAPADRTQALSTGFPQRREDLYAYDALVLVDVEGDVFTRAQLQMIADFVAERGGGVLVAGGWSFRERGLAGTPLEAVLPVELDDRRTGVVRAAFVPGTAAGRSAPNQLVVTADGALHPIMRLGASGDDTRAKWAALPALAASAPLGPPRPGASVLAVVSSPDGGMFPVVAVQRYGQGRAMIFGGEASWRWRMLAPAADRSHELFWRQAARWLSTASPDPVSLSTPDSLEPGDSAALDIIVRDGAFMAVPDAQVTAVMTMDGGSEEPLRARRTEVAGHFAAAFAPDKPGVYRIHAEAMRGATRLGTSDRAVYVSGGNREFADPRLNEAFLRRLARDSGGQYVRASDAARVLMWLDDSAKRQAEPELRDLWNRPWMLALVVCLLCAEWTLRRRWGWR
jgi:uncharacterized membrane protein